MPNMLRDELERLSASSGLTKLVELHDVIFSDTEPLRGVEAVYLFGQTQHQEQGMFSSAKEIRDKGLQVPVFVLNGPDPSDTRYKQSGFPGFAQWSARLKSSYGLEAVPLQPRDMNKLNTFTEAEALVDLSEADGPKSWYLVAANFHMPRAFISAASVVIQRLPSLKVYAYPGAEQDWNEVVIHSQGVTTGTRRDLIRGEVERIKNYTKPGNLEPLERVLEYCAKRATL